MAREFSTSLTLVAPPPLPFDVIESVLSLLPAPDLLSAAAVSPSWRRAALCSPRRRPPSLLLHTQTLRRHLSSATATTSTLEPNSQTWLHLPPRPSPPFPLCSSTSGTLLYTLSSSHLSISSDPIHLRWSHLPPPPIWRLNPIVSFVGPFLVAVGGVCELEDNPLAVEVFDGDWRLASSMPNAFKTSSSAYHLSAVVAGGRLHVVERQTGLASSFDPFKGIWSEPVELLTDIEQKPFAVAVAATSDGRLVVAGVMGRSLDVTGVRLWEEKANLGLVEVGEMPPDMVRRFAMGPRCNSASGVFKVEVRVADAGGYVYIYNPSEMGEVFHFRPGSSGGEWGSVVTGVESRSDTTVVITCSPVSMEELREGLRGEPTAGELVLA